MAFHPKAGSGSESVTKSVAEDALAGGGPAQGGGAFVDAGDCSFGVRLRCRKYERAKMAGDGSSG